MDWTDSWLGNGSELSGSGLGNISNDTEIVMTCVAESLVDSAYPYSYGLSVATRVVLIAFYSFLFIAGTALNGFMIYLICKYKNLQSMSFVMALQIVIINFLSCMIHIPLAVTAIAANKWMLGEKACIVTGVVHYAVWFTRTEVMLSLVIDRFLLVFCPFGYPKYRLKTLIFLFIASHVVPILLSAVAGYLGCVSFSPGIGQCHLSFDCGLVCTVYRGAVALVVILPSCIVPLFLYACLFCKAKKINERAAPSTAAIASLDTEIEMRATITFFLMFLALSAVTTPHAITYLIGTTIYYSSTPPLGFQVVEAICANIVSLILILDPVVLMRNAEVKEEITNIGWLPLLWC